MGLMLFTLTVRAILGLCNHWVIVPLLVPLKKQKLNTRSSTETELVSADDVMPQVLWTTYFLDAQGYDVKDTIMYQDNQSAMLLEKHGRAY